MRILVAGVAAFSAAISSAWATVLTFDDFGDHSIIYDDYGDLIDASHVRGFPYRIEAEGTTPDVFVGLEESLRIDSSDFDGNEVAVATSGDSDISFEFSGVLTPKQVMVQLHDFVLYSRSGTVENVIVEVYDHTCDTVFQRAYDVTEDGTRISFSQGTNLFLSGWILDVSIRAQNSFDAARLGLDDIRFGQSAGGVATPLPAAAWMMVAGLLGVAGVRRRSR